MAADRHLSLPGTNLDPRRVIEPRARRYDGRASPPTLQGRERVMDIEPMSGRCHRPILILRNVGAGRGGGEARNRHERPHGGAQGHRRAAVGDQ
jgi:hypothetical protein